MKVPSCELKLRYEASLQPEEQYLNKLDPVTKVGGPRTWAIRQQHNAQFGDRRDLTKIPYLQQGGPIWYTAEGNLFNTHDANKLIGMYTGC